MNALVKILKMLLGSQPQQISTLSEIDKIIDATSTVTGVTRLQMLSKRRTPDYANARHIVMYLATQMTKMSLPEIGRTLNRDHTTVYYAVNKIENRGRGNTKLNRSLSAVKALVS